MNGIKVYLFLIVDDSNGSVVDNRVFKTKELALACLHKNICETLQDELEMGNKITPDEMSVFEPKDEDIVDFSKENYDEAMDNLLKLLEESEQKQRVELN